MNYSAVERNKDYSEFVQLSAELGGNSNLVQGSGGNTSIKINGKMLVKASGKWLCDSLNDQIFVQLDLEHYLEKIRKDGVQYSPEVDPNQSLRPSIETCMHGLMPQKIILHVHSVSVIARSVLNDGALALENILMGMKWKWVPYHRPGSSLGESIREIFQNLVQTFLF